MPAQRRSGPTVDQSRLGDLLDALGVGVARVALDGRVLYASPALSRMLGYADPEALTGSDIRGSLLPGTSWEGILEELRARSPDPGAHPIEVVVRRKDGTTVPVAGLGRLAELDGEVVVEGVARETTLERRLRQEVLDVGERERARMAAALHDDLGQLLTGVSVHAGLLLRWPGSELSLEARTVARRIEELVARALAKVRTLARESDVDDNADQDLRSALVSLADETERVFAVSVDLTVHPSWPRGPRPETEHLHRIAREAMTNAVRHGSAKRIEVVLAADDGAWRFDIADDGDGLRSAVGVPGMGLRLAEHRARLLGGRLSLEQRREGGARMRVAFPAVSHAQSQGGAS